MNKIISIFSQGCAANFGDGEQIARLLESLGYKTVFAKENANAFCLNVCTVKGESTALQLLNKIKNLHPNAPILLTGCIPPSFAQKLEDEPSTVSIANLDILRQKKELLNHWLSGETIRSNLKEVSPRTFANGSPKESPHIGILNISDGCLDACSFCSTRLVKGKHRSVPPESIVKEATRYLENGCKELWLTGQDTSCYGFDIGTNLAKLAKEILDHNPHDYKLRLGMGNPRHLSLYLEEMLSVFEDERIYKFIHLPVQSGSDSVLKNMGRRHDVQTFRNLAEAFTNKFPYFTLSTDIIVGFPGETNKDFENTCKLIEDLRPTICNITRFVPREGTVAAKLHNKVPGKEQHRRSAELSSLFQKIALQNNSKCIGKISSVLTEKKGHREGTFIARDEAYRPVALQGDFTPGEWLSVEIERAETFALCGKVISKKL